MRALVLSSIFFAACYSPTLGNEPFFCGSAAPQCPDGYTCKMDTAGHMVCVSSNGGSATTDGMAGFQCADDSQVEGPNHDDTIATAFQTPVAINRNSVSFAGLAICPASDKDFYRVDLTGTQSITAVVTYDDPTKPGAGPLKMSIDNMSGAALVSATLVTGMPNTIQAVAMNLPMASSPYYIEVEGDGTNENNYKLDISVQ